MAKGVNRSTSSYVVLDTMPLVSLAQQEQQYNRKINAEKAAKRATGAAKLNESFDKLNTKVWERDNAYMQDLVNDTEDWMAQTYSEHGETAIYDNPKLKQEFQSRLNHIRDFAQMSRNQQQMANKQLEERAGNPDELSYESAANFDRWLDLPPEQRVLQPVPMVTQRLTTLSEAVTKYGKPHLEGLLQPFEYAGAVKEETGEYATYEGKRLDEKRLNNLVQSYNTNPNSVIFRTADREAREDFDYEKTSPIMLDAEGNQVPNPAFETELARVRSERIKDEILRQADKEYTKSGRRFVPGAAQMREDQVEVVETTPGEAQYTTEETPAAFRKNVRFSGTATDDTGKVYYKLKTPSYSYQGEVYASKDDLPQGVTVDDATEIPIGSYVDGDGNVKPDDTDLTETKDVKTYKAEREVNVKKPGATRTLNVDSYYKPDGTKVSTAEGTAVEGQMIGHVEVKAVEKGGKLYFEGSKEYKKGKPKRMEITKIKTKKGEIVQVPTTDNVRATYSAEYDKIDAGSGVTYTTKKTGKTSGISWK